MTNGDTLDLLIRDLRRELRAELPLVLHSRTYGDPEDVSDPRKRTNRPPGSLGWTGLPFAPAFARRLAHRDWWGIGELAASSIGETGDWCRSRHQSDLHRCPGRSTSLCERIVAALAELSQPLEHVAWREGLDVDTTRQLAERALSHAFAWRHRRLHQYMRAAKDSQLDRPVYCPMCLNRPVMMRMRRRRAA